MPAYQITKAEALGNEAREIESLLRAVFVGEGYTDSASASKAFLFERLQNRGELLVAKRAITGEVLGVAVSVPPTSEARQVAGRSRNPPAGGPAACPR